MKRIMRKNDEKSGAKRNLKAINSGKDVFDVFLMGEDVLVIGKDVFLVGRDVFTLL